MTDDLKPYPAYSSTDLPWLISIPENWRVLRAKNVFRPIDVRSTTGNEELLTVSSNYGVVPRRQTTVTMFKAESYVGHKLCWPGDLVINSLWAWMQGLGVAKHHGLISSAYSVYRPRPNYASYGNYFHELLRSSAYKWELMTRSRGVWISRLQLSDAAFFDMPLLIPPANEGAAIVRYLNHIDYKINRYILSKKKLIGLLNEQKQAIIHRAVTQGLDANVKLKPSKTPWVQKIPQDWDEALLGRFVSRIEQGWSPIAAEGEIADEQWSVLTLSAVKRGKFNDSAAKPISSEANVPKHLEVKVGDLLLSRSNTRELVGDVCVVEACRPKTIICDLIYRLQLFERRLLPRYLMYFLLSSAGRGQIERDARGSSGTMPKIAHRHIQAWRIILPPINEQLRIVECLDTDLLALNQAISRIEREIGFIREYRTRLVSEVVTGKLDVRAAAAKLPDLTPEAEPLDEIDDVLQDEAAAEDFEVAEAA
jgi:type I restriction enzyme S subunit